MLELLHAIIYSYITKLLNANKATITCYKHERSKDTKNILPCFINGKKMNICSHDGRSIQELPQDFTLEMGLRTCRWDFALHTGKSHVPYKLLINGLLRLKSWDLPLPWDLFIQEGFGTWDHV